MKITHITALVALIAASTTTSFAGRGPEVRFSNDSQKAPIVKQMTESKQMAKKSDRTPHQVRVSRANQVTHRSTTNQVKSAQAAQCLCAAEH